jgi:hypothetical protein
MSFGIIVLISAILITGFYQLDHFVTADEPAWLRRSGNFYYAIGQRDWDKTFQREHPGVVNMWAGTLGYLIVFPDYRGLGQGYFDSETKQNRFFAAHDIEPLDILVAGRAVNVVINTILFLVAFFLLTKLLEFWYAWFAMILVVTEPMTIAFSRLLHLDGLLTAFMLVSTLGIIIYVLDGRKQLFLVISAVTAGLAFLTKSPGIFMVPFVGLVLLAEGVREYRIGNPKPREFLNRTIYPFLIWFAIFAVVFMLFWPAALVDPIKSLRSIFEQALFYANDGHSSNTFFNGQILENGQTSIFFYPLTVLWRISVPTLIGIFLLGTGLLKYFPHSIFKTAEIRLYIFSLSFILFFVVFIAMGEKQFDRYILPVYPMMGILSMAGYKYVFQYAFTALPSKRKMKLTLFIGGLALISIGVQIYVSAPYFLNYYNPILGGGEKATNVMQIGWGEGLDEAGRYLNEISENENFTVMSWYHNGSFSYFFDGETNLKGMNGRITEEIFQSLFESDYLVIYIHQWQRNLPHQIIESLHNYEPLSTIKINGIPYVDIFRVSDLERKDFTP